MSLPTPKMKKPPPPPKEGMEAPELELDEDLDAEGKDLRGKASGLQQLTITRTTPAGSMSRGGSGLQIRR